MVFSPFEQTDVSHYRRVKWNSKLSSRLARQRSSSKQVQIDSIMEHAKARVGTPLGAEQEFRSRNGASQPGGCVFPNPGSHGGTPGVPHEGARVEVVTVVAVDDARWDPFKTRLAKNHSRGPTNVGMHDIVPSRTKNPAKPKREG
jgi:hypothetical protein